MSLSRRNNLYVVPQVAAAYPKLCHLKDRDVTKFTVISEKERNNVKMYKRHGRRRQGVKDEDTKKKKGSLLNLN
jgi:hypothetical protein